MYTVYLFIYLQRTTPPCVCAICGFVYSWGARRHCIGYSWVLQDWGSASGKDVQQRFNDSSYLQRCPVPRDESTRFVVG